MKKVFSLDAETDGLWGNPFAVAAIVYELRTVEVPAQAVELSGAQMQAKYGGGGKLWPRDVVQVAGCTTTEWVETARFIARLSDDVVSDNWVRENVLPALEGVPVTHPEGEYVFEAQQTGYCDINAYEAMIADFAEFYNANKADADVICHMGYIVEAHLLREMHHLGFIGDWDAPYPLLDVSGNLQAAGEDPTSVDNYAKKHGLEVADYGTTHNPLYDCEVAAKAYIHLNQ